MNRKYVIPLLGAFVPLCAQCSTPAVHAAETLRVAGGSAPMENVFKRVKSHYEAKTGVRLELIDEGPVKAYGDLNADKIDVASAGMMYSQWVKQVDPAVVNQLERAENNLQANIVGVDYVTVYTNNGIWVRELTLEQVRGIFTGEITNWSEVGARDAPITVVLGTKVAGLMSEFQRQVLGGSNFTDKAVFVETARDMKEKVKRIPGSVSLGTLAQIQDEQVNSIEYPAPSRYITIAWKWSSPKRKRIQELYYYLCSGEARQYTLSEYRRPGKKKKAGQR